MEAKGREGYVLPMSWVSGHRAICAVRELAGSAEVWQLPMA